MAEKDKQLDYGRGWATSQIIRPQESLVLFKSFNTLWKQTSREKTEMVRVRLVHENEGGLKMTDRQTETDKQ
jgi:hypothetical protein